MLSGIAVFHERFSWIRWAGFEMLLVGLPLFFIRRLPERLNLHSGLGLGVALLVGCSIIWVVYGLAQKWLLRRLPSQQILLLLYVASTLVLWPAAHPVLFLLFVLFLSWLFVFCCAF